MLLLTIIKTLITRFWKEILIAIALVLVYKAVYDRGYDSAYTARTSYYEEILKKNQDAIISKIDNIEKISGEQANIARTNHNTLVTDLTKITGDIKNKNFVIYKNGECIPSPDFSQDFNSIILRGNKK